MPPCRAIALTPLVLSITACGNIFAPEDAVGRWTMYEINGYAVPGVVVYATRAKVRYTRYFLDLSQPGAWCTGQWLKNHSEASLFIEMVTITGDIRSISNPGKYCVDVDGTIRMNLGQAAVIGTIERNEMTFEDWYGTAFKLRKNPS